SLGARVTNIAFDAAENARLLNPRGLIIAAEAYTLNRRLLDQHFDDLDPVVAHRMVKGRDVPAHEYLQTTLDWKRVRAEALEQMHGFDALLCPSTMVPALPLAAADSDIESYSDANLKCLRNTAIGNVLDLCGLSVPCGRTGGGLPIGLMIYGRPFDEGRVLRIGHAFQRATDWHKVTPPLFP
ncbi:MAG: amidase family protein, partial [Gammaproteobacteria bacterium]|nr:amidase family protein [Gammaproteobacteria bacterium]